ncbi:FAD monooxygenase [Histoplasma ohiense]|nr:FAD monooxygenase [Histoplasma ohiense (nom. inval.)]
MALLINPTSQLEPQSSSQVLFIQPRGGKIASRTSLPLMHRYTTQRLQQSRTGTSNIHQRIVPHPPLRWRPRQDKTTSERFRHKPGDKTLLLLQLPAERYQRRLSFRTTHNPHSPFFTLFVSQTICPGY